MEAECVTAVKKLAPWDVTSADLQGNVGESSPLKMVARHFMLSLCQLTPLNLEEPLPVGRRSTALGFTLTVRPAPRLCPEPCL